MVVSLRLRSAATGRRTARGSVRRSARLCATTTRGRGELPGADEAAAAVGPQAQAEAVEPLPVGRVAPEAGPQVARAVPGVGPAHAAGVLDRQGGRVELLPPV